MKRVILSMLVLIVAVAASADYGYMKFTTTGGEATTISADGLKITFAGGVATATAGADTRTYTLVDLSTMAFTDVPLSQYHRLDVNKDTNVDVGDVNAVLADIIDGIGTTTLDVNGDNAVDVGDVNTILNYILTGTDSRD